MVQLESSLPAVGDWIKRAETGPPTWRMTSHDLAVELRDGQAGVVESP
jgi:hypothetical protein